MLLRRLTRLEGSLLRVFPLSSCSIPMARRTRSTAAKYEEASMPSLPDSKISQTKRDADNLDNQPRSPKAEADDARESSSPPKKKTKRTAEPRAKKEPPDHSAFEYPVRTVATSSKALGFHASTSGGVELSCINALKQGATGFALFLKNQRQWASKPLTEETLRLFPLHCAGATSAAAEADQRPLGDGKGFSRAKHVIPHGSYLVNLGNPTPDKWQKAFDGFLDEVKRAEQLGVAHLNIHPGSSTGICTREEAIASIAKGVNLAHQQTSRVCVLLENMAAQGNVIGGRFEDLADIIALVEDKTRIGVTFDTCHAFAFGHDLRTPEAVQATISSFDQIVGLKYLKALHVNDSKGDFESHRDLHENIGCGHIGLIGFAALMGDPRLDDLPFILETPDVAPDDANYKVEIELLHKLELVARRSSADTLAANIQDDEELQSQFEWLKSAVASKAQEKQAKAKSGPKGQSKTSKKMKAQRESDDSA